jgi:hypothetical protein
VSLRQTSLRGTYSFPPPALCELLGRIGYDLAVQSDAPPSVVTPLLILYRLSANTCDDLLLYMSSTLVDLHYRLHLSDDVY